MSDVQLGKHPTIDAARDAIHVAVVPMIASIELRPGQRVGVADGKVEPAAKSVGIVDPYLTRPVAKGELFWLCLMPNTVTGMRHHWSHPAFDSATVTVDEKAASVEWLKEAARTLGVNYETLIAEWSPLESNDYINNGEHIRDLWYDMHEEFWKHHRIVTGREVPESDRGGFTCSC